MQQLALWEEPAPTVVEPEPLDLFSYDHYIIFFSGGKDSLACILYLLESGINPTKIELWHHLIDGTTDQFMDWPCTPAYCKAVAKALGLPIYFQWRVGGFRRELLKDGDRLAPAIFTTPDGELHEVGGKTGEIATRRKFPAVVGDLTRRWCSSVLKIDVAAAALRNDPRFVGKRVLTISGERAQESPKRSCYAEFEIERGDLRNGIKRQRHLDRHRPIHKWDEAQVWKIIKRWRINPHPAYWLGWGRCSCMFCIFGSPNQVASAREVNPTGHQQLVDYEIDFGWTIHNGEAIEERANRGTPYQMDRRMMRLAMSEEYNELIILDDWQLPPGAFGESAGPS